jgi:hypothetical protein
MAGIIAERDYLDRNSEGQIKGVDPTVFHKKRMANVDTNTLC